MIIEFEKRNWIQYSFRLEYRQLLYISFKGMLSQVNYGTPMRDLSSEWKCKITNKRKAEISFLSQILDSFLYFTPLTLSSDTRKFMRKLESTPSSINLLHQANPQHTEFYSRLQCNRFSRGIPIFHCILLKLCSALRDYMLEIKMYFQAIYNQMLL